MRANSRSMNCGGEKRPQKLSSCAVKAAAVGAAALCGVIVAGVVAVDCSPALQRRVLAAARRAIDERTKGSVLLSWQRASFALWRGRVVLHGVVCEAREGRVRVGADQVVLGLRPALSVARVLRSVEVCGVDARLNLKSTPKLATWNHRPHAALDIDNDSALVFATEDTAATTKLKEETVGERKRSAEHTAFNIGQVTVRDARISLIPPWTSLLFAAPHNLPFLSQQYKSKCKRIDRGWRSWLTSTKRATCGTTGCCVTSCCPERSRARLQVSACSTQGMYRGLVGAGRSTRWGCQLTPPLWAGLSVWHRSQV